MFTCNIMGGLGNQLFQIFATIGMAMKHGDTFGFMYKTTAGGVTLRNTYWENLLIELKKYTYLRFPPVYKNENPPGIQEIKEESFSYQNIILPNINRENIYFLNGYFQSYKYFEKYFGEIVRLIKLEEIKKKVLQKVPNFKENNISMHFRIGDYKKLQHCHPIMPYSYYKNSLLFFKNALTHNPTSKTPVLYFCEDQDLNSVTQMIKFLEVEFGGYFTFERAPSDLNDWEQLLLMSCCKHNIIANSTYSWWGAVFNSNQYKLVCYPSVWFGPALHHKTNDLFPLNWTKIEIQ